MQTRTAGRVFSGVAVIIGAALAGGGVVIRAEFGQDHIRSEILKHFSGSVDTRSFRVHYFPGPGCTIEGLTMRTRSDPPDAPFGFVDRVEVESSYLTLIGGSKRIRITVDHGRIRLSSLHDLASDFHSGGGEKTVVELAQGDDLALDIGPNRDDVLHFQFRRLRAGPFAEGQSAEAQIDMVNPLPRGELSVQGHIGPWHSPLSETPLTGSFHFDRADLASFSALSGTLASAGRLHGRLGRIGVDGDAQVRDFEVKVSSHPVQLNSKYRAEVNGQNGDVDLPWVESQWGQTRLLTTGRVTDAQGEPGKVADLKLSVDRGRIEDLMDLVMHSAPTLRGPAAFQATAVWPPGPEPFIRRIEFAANFHINPARFTRRQVQENFNKLSERAMGEKDRRIDEVVADLKGHVDLRGGVAHFTHTLLAVPGASASVAGTANLVDKRLDIAGHLRTEASLSEANTGLKSVLLKPLNPFFRNKRESAGADVPIQLTGTIDAPHVGLDLRHKGLHRSGAE